ncbi:hypothetical protein MLD38_036573 [Melastoma candidum]|uniref:Uncharacterized protein n=1 Tax=Melastoma candidum TaxID=119954 RepID=A0ACB9LKN5_9MYRT|nr:hypothetical protein MLD38_036573 [Melastoma candidum]
MGSFLSTSPDPAEGTGLGDLPESCAASILGYLEPTDVCRLGGLNRAFRGASWADVVWEAKLPENYGVIVEKVFGGLARGGGLCKREIYTALCGGSTFDGGTKRVWLDKFTGRICLSVCAKGLVITGVDDRRYWNYISTTESRFSEVAYLQQTWWLQAEGEVEFPFPKGNYSIFFRLQLGRTARRFPGRRVCETEHVHGWDKKPVQFQLSTSDGHSASSQCFLANPGKWVNYHVGDFIVRSHDAPTKVKFSLTQIDCTHTKGGLCIDSLLICPARMQG